MWLRKTPVCRSRQTGAKEKPAAFLLAAAPKQSEDAQAAQQCGRWLGDELNRELQSRRWSVSRELPSISSAAILVFEHSAVIASTRPYGREGCIERVVEFTGSSDPGEGTAAVHGPVQVMRNNIKIPEADGVETESDGVEINSSRVAEILHGEGDVLGIIDNVPIGTTIPDPHTLRRVERFESLSGGRGHREPECYRVSRTVVEKHVSRKAADVVWAGKEGMDILVDRHHSRLAHGSNRGCEDGYQELGFHKCSCLLLLFNHSQPSSTGKLNEALVANA